MRIRTEDSPSSGGLDRGGENASFIPEQEDAESLFPQPRTYSPDASVLLVGIRGSGRSTLALVASTALRFRLVDSERIFHSKFGKTRAAYAAAYGSDEYKRQEVELLRSILQQCPTGAVIVCGSATVEGFSQQLVRDFSKSHPVIFILRDASDVSQYLGSCNETVISTLIDRSSPAFRTLSNFEFYNLSGSSASINSKDHGTQPSLVLKGMERDFLQWLFSTRRQEPRLYLDKAQHSLSSVPLERRIFTYSLSLPIGNASAFADQTRGTDILVDAIELTFDIAPLCSGKGFDHSVATQMTRQYFITRRSFHIPIVIHVVLPAGGNKQSSLVREVYLRAIAHALRLAPDYLTVDFHLDESDIRKIISARGHTRMIGHYFESCPSTNHWRSPQTMSLPQKMESAQCDVARLCQTAKSRMDNQSVQQFILAMKSSGEISIPIIAYNTGRLGRPSCLLNQILTPITHSLLKGPLMNGSDDSSWLLTMQELHSALYSSYTLEAQFFGILGAEVVASLSPAMHNSAFEAFQLPHKYLTLQSASLSELDNLVQDTSFGGASITAPFKQEIIPVLDYLSQSSRAIGAVNTLIPLRTDGLQGLLSRNETGPITALYGDNTDWIGIFNCIRQNLSPVNAVRPNTTALVLGAGGMAHACVYSMIRLGIQTIFVCNRTEEKAQELANRFSGKTYSTDHSSLDEFTAHNVHGSTVCGPADVKVIPSVLSPWPTAFNPPTVIVSCIPSASQNGPTNFTISDRWLASKTGGVLIELSYDTLETPLMKQVREFSNCGWIAVHGLEMLPEQGFAQFELFTGRRAPENVMRSQITRGFMELAQEHN